MPPRFAQTISLIRNRPWAIVYAAVVVYFIGAVLANYSPGEGFTSMLTIGDQNFEKSTSEFKETSPRTFENSAGYDGQFYAQLALDPTLRDPEFKKAIDNLPYRGRRILMPAIGWLLGLGQPDWIVNIYPLINPICWLFCALLLLHWLPPTDFQNLIRWAGILLGWGWVSSIQNSLTDGPATCLTLLALFLLDKNKRYAAAWSIAASILTKDTSALAGLTLLPQGKLDAKNLAKAAGLGAAALLPFAIWYLYMSSIGLSASSTGSRNFSLPFVALTEKVYEVLKIMLADFSWANATFALGILGLCGQILYFLFFPKWKSVWWRCGIGFAALGCVLGTAVWEGLPGAAPRVLLVLHIAFNMRLPRGKAWLPLLLLANVSILDFPERLKPAYPSERSQKLTATEQFLSVGEGLALKRFRLEFGEGWEKLERHKDLQWRWTNGRADIKLRSEYPAPIETRIKLRVSTHYQRTGELYLNGEKIFEFDQSPTLEEFVSPPISLNPGENVLTFAGDPLGKKPSPTDDRPLGLSLFRISLLAL